MITSIFIYNVVPLKANFNKLKATLGGRFILIASEYVIRSISEEYINLFEKIYVVTHNYHQVSCDEVDLIVTEYIKDVGAINIRLLSNEDSTQLVCAKLREKYGIKGHTTQQVLPFVDKTFSKSKLQDVVKLPKYVKFDKLKYANNAADYLASLVNDIGFPMLSKPIDLVSSIGVTKIVDFATLTKVAESIFNSEYEFEIDEFIDGTLYHCDLIVCNGDVKFIATGKYSFPLANFAHGKPMGSLLIPQYKLRTEIELAARKIIQQIGQFSSAFHFEFFIRHDSGDVVFLEVSARTPGALVPSMYELMFDMNLEELHYLAQLNLLDTLNVSEPSTYVAWLSYPQKAGIVEKFNEPNYAINSLDFIKYVKPGDNLQPAISLLDSSCSIVISDPSYLKILDTFEELKLFTPLSLKESRI